MHHLPGVQGQRDREIVGMGTIYHIRNRVTGAVYVGSCAGNRLRFRWMRHRSDLRSQCHHNRHLQHAWNKYGEEAFEFVEVEAVDDSELLSREQYHIDLRKDFPRQLTYNVCPVAGNCFGRKFLASAIAKMSASHLGVRRTRASIRRQQETRSKLYGRNFTVLGPDGTIYNRRSMRAFCRERNLKISSLRKLFAGELRSTKGYTLPGVNKKTYCVTSPDGKTVTVTNLKSFCIDRGLPYKQVHKVVTGVREDFRGWTAERIH